MKYLLEIAYDGANYKGWQFQKNERTIQGILEEKLSVILRDNIKLHAAGRTDTGVHAKMQCAHFEILKEINKEKVKYSLNSLLKNETIIVINIKEVDNVFHARFSCLMKEYRYNLLIGEHDVFLNNRYWLVPKFDIEKAQECANYFVGNHNFSSFRDSQCQALSPVRTIKSFKFEQKNKSITAIIQAKSFLHHQVRIMIGTIFEITSKKENSSKIMLIIEQKNRKFAGLTAPAKGLFLEKIQY
ncbi:tRNA pseudouridine(38-40) synthase TruA [Alphaproteobacteria bacterium endosymbiont of Tiliacea citrago]|uniref:tRNA pseudouridine(38-40) synthase TruA n=1 Tax=Alphaproteobacteria bacterium endosymbiont of Tiliacea citrago TaxID=3077944 RepID=UPI00313F1C0B